MALAFLMKPPPGSLILAMMLFCSAAYCLGLAPATWVVMSEIFPTRIRGRAMSVATVSLWAACTILTLTFLSLVTALTISGAFAVYAAMCVIEVLLVWRAVPETAGRTLEEIAGYWSTVEFARRRSTTR
jgi:SP family arabinose:H+ symporter-like MFS transporter